MNSFFFSTTSSFGWPRGNGAFWHALLSQLGRRARSQTLRLFGKTVDWKLNHQESRKFYHESRISEAAIVCLFIFSKKSFRMKTPKELNDKGQSIIGAAIEVHKFLGPGLLESVYQEAMTIALEDRGHRVKTEVPIQLRFKEKIIANHLRIDMLVDDLIILELKAATNIPASAEAQLLTYLKLTGRQLGYIINFHEETLLKGLRRMVHKLPESP